MWGVTEELLAQLIEEVSVLTADRRRKEPREVPRPGPAAEPEMGLTGSVETGYTARGLEGFLGAALATGAVRLNG
jgi:hypothetical protein